MIYDDGDSDVGADNEGNLDMDEQVNLDDISDSDSDVDDDLLSDNEVKPNKRKVLSSSEERDRKETKRRKVVHRSDNSEQECEDECVRGM